MGFEMKLRMHKTRIRVIFVVIMIASAFVLLPLTTTAVAPTFSNPYPANGASDAELTPTLHITVNDAEGDTMNITFRTNATGTWGDVGSNNSVSNGTYYQTNSSMNSYSTKYWWSVNCTDGSSWTNETYHFTTISQYTPDQPSSFTATTNSSSEIYLTWAKGNKADYTYIERNTSGISVWAKEAGTEIYNDTGTGYSDTGLNEGVTYYYQAWSWNTTDGAWSTGNTSASNATKNRPVLSNENPTNGSSSISLNPTLQIQVNHNGGYQMNITWYWGTDSSCPNYIGSNSSVNNGTYYMNNDNNFSSNSQLYYWKVCVNDGHDEWTNETYHFTTLDFLWIDVTNATWNLGMVAMENSTWTNETGETFICDMDNTTTNADLSLQITTDGATWKDASTPGDDRYRIYASADNWSNLHLISEDSSATISTVTAGQNETFDLRFDAPTSSTTKVQQSITITATIVKH